MRFDFLFDRFLATLETPTQFAHALAILDVALPKTVSVVGNAKGLLGTGHGSDIDSRPTIRFNSAQIVDPEAQGLRWDFVASSMSIVLRFYRENEPKFSALIYTAHTDQHVRNLRRIGCARPAHLYPLILSRELLIKLRSRPTTGMQMLYLLDRLGRKDVSIFGFDWKATPTFYHTAVGKDPHNYRGERELIASLIDKNGWRLVR